MSAEKLSISMESELVSEVRSAAGDEGVSVSTWLAVAAEARVRQRRLREALDAVAAQDGELSPAEIERLIAAARRTTQIVTGSVGAA
ncbi:MAG: hypothetical protein ACT4RN_18205 [Pseudonocardia sp.]